MQGILEEANSLAFSFPIPGKRIIWDLYPCSGTSPVSVFINGMSPQVPKNPLWNAKQSYNWTYIQLVYITQDFFTKHPFINTAVTKAVPFLLLLKSSSSASFLVQPAYTTPLVRISWVWPPIDATHWCENPHAATTWRCRRCFATVPLLTK
jgi:hypothetical protein